MTCLRKYAQGQIFSGQGAKERGLVDEIAGLWQAGRLITKELGLKEDEFGFKFIKLKKEFSMSDIFTEIEQTVEDIKLNEYMNFQVSH